MIDIFRTLQKSSDKIFIFVVKVEALKWRWIDSVSRRILRSRKLILYVDTQFSTPCFQLSLMRSSQIMGYKNGK